MAVGQQLVLVWFGFRALELRIFFIITSNFIFLNGCI